MRATALALLFSSIAMAQEPAADALKLPEAPKADAKSEHKALQPDKKLLIETKGDGTKRVLVAAEVCLREGPLELLVCKKNSKEHEAILRVDVDAKFIHAALEACGAKAGAPVQFVNVKTQEPEYKPASGAVIKTSIYFKKGDKATTEKAQEWITEIKTKKAMPHDWVFAGSRLVKNPDKPEDPAIYTANLGEIISVSNKRDSMLELPVKSTDADAELLFQANTDKIPPLGSMVWLILEPEAKK